MNRFHELEIAEVRRETADSVSLRFAVPEALAEAFRFRPGQYLTLRATIDGEDARRSYSISSGLGEATLRVGIRKVPGGLFSTYATERLKAGDRLDVMPPQGRFTLDPAPEVARHVLCIAAGSGITPVLSILKSLLALEPLSRATLVYGNRTSATAMFVEEIEGLKNRFLGRFQVLHVLSREPQDVPLLSGRIDAAKLAALAAGAVDFASADAVYACGPDGMLRAVEDNIPLFGVSREKIHIERFGTAASRGPRTPAAAIVAEKPLASVFVTLDGRRHVFDMRESDGSLIDAAARSGLELPYSCKGGMCCTCRCRIEAGAATMAVNYSLEPWEIEKGFTLACQARPVTPELALDFDTL